MSKLPFGLKAPSKGTVIFCSVLGTISGTIYTSTEFAKNARKAHCDKVSFLADRPCGVHVIIIRIMGIIKMTINFYFYFLQTEKVLKKITFCFSFFF